MMDSIELHKNLDEEQSARLMSLEQLFEHEGWSVIEEWAKGQAEIAASAAANASNWDENRIQFGKGAVYNTVHNLPDAVNAQFAALAEANIVSAEEAEITDEIDSQS